MATRVDKRQGPPTQRGDKRRQGTQKPSNGHSQRRIKGRPAEERGSGLPQRRGDKQRQGVQPRDMRRQGPSSNGDKRRQGRNPAKGTHLRRDKGRQAQKPGKETSRDKAPRNGHPQRRIMKGDKGRQAETRNPGPRQWPRTEPNREGRQGDHRTDEA